MVKFVLLLTAAEMLVIWGCMAALVCFFWLLDEIAAFRFNRRTAKRNGEAAKTVPTEDTGETEAEDRKSRQMAEGFDNLMTYTVNLGRGRTTGGEL